MTSSVYPQLLLITIVSLMFCLIIIPVYSQCLEDQRILLLQMKDSFKFNSSLSTKLINWNTSTDCCHWSGVSCDKAGHITGLDLNSESIYDGIDHSGGLFSFQYLQSLNLGHNSFNYVNIPSGFGNLTSLTYLNLSNSSFAGQIPNEFPHLTRLVVLDLSTILYFAGTPSLKLENPSLSRLVENLTELTELYLDGVNISAQGREWCGALSSSLPSLQVLSLSNCYISGPIDSSLEKLQSLSVIRLSQNNLSAQVPEFFANFSNLTALRLSFCNLSGTFPEKIFQVSTLRSVDLSGNELLQGSIPEFPQNRSLQILMVRFTNFSKNLPNSIGNLGNLSRIELANCKFSGPIPFSMANLTQLVYLDFSSNMFTGPIPSFRMCKNVTRIDFSRNDLNGAIPSNYFKGLLQLVSVDLRFNSFNGTIPLSLFSLPSLQKLQLSNNKFDGQIPKFSLSSPSLLDTLDISSNNLEGPIPKSIYVLRKLNVLLLSSNNFTGLLKVDMISSFPNLTTLDLSFNSLSIDIDISSSSSSSSSFPRMTKLILASCNLQKFPDLRNQSRLVYLDLSDNQIVGEIPNWIWNVGNGTLMHLNLSFNLLVGLQEPYVIPNLSVLDLHHNRLGGKIPILRPGFAIYVDYSGNNFKSSIPPDIGKNISFASFFSLSNNNLTGTIPESICNPGFLQVLDLSNNGLSGPIPPCLVENSSKTLGVLNLRNNKLIGNILGTFPSGCRLKTLDLSGNQLEGQVPKSLENCSSLEVLNLGNNKINDEYPCFLKSSSNLRVLVLRSNSFYGGISCQGSIKDSWPNLQIIDLAFNKFDDELKCFLSWKSMMLGENNSQSQLNHLQFEFLGLNNFYYQDRVTVTNKGLQMELIKILTVFTSIDFSSNGFHGTIPDTVGALKSLYVLNLSHNVLTGPIPLSIGNLAQLGSLDLSSNKLNGSIPVSLANLNFLSFLNLSYNFLVGRIPIGTQIQSFNDTSFSGNEGLCGLPLNNNSCYDSPPTTTYSPESGFMPFKELHWQFIFTGLGYGVGAGIVVGPLMFWKKLRIWCDEQTDKLVLTILSASGFVYTSCDDLKVEGEGNEDEDSDDDDDGDSKEEEHEMEGEAIRGRYCLFCSKLDICRKKIIHNPKCNCHDPPSKSSSSSSSSSFSPLAENTKF